MRLSDIFKKKTAISNTNKITHPVEVAKEKPKPKEEIALNPKEIYGETVALIREIFETIETKKIPLEKLLTTVKKLQVVVKKNTDEMLILSTRSTPDLYLYSHSVNVSILSLIIALGLKFSEEDLSKLSICALLHDIGMLPVAELALKPAKLTEAEFEKIKKHPEYAIALLDNIIADTNWKQTISTVIIQVHERKNAKGYPAGLKEENIHQWARIIGIADAYEAMTHPRKWRERYLPHNALKMLIEQAQTDFDIDLVKLLIEQISLYPPGSYVRLNTGEICKIVGITPNSPLRPKIKLLFDASGKLIKDSTIIDLTENTKLAITEPVDEFNLKIPDKKFALSIKSQRWWI